jgi:hypothetical protein
MPTGKCLTSNKGKEIANYLVICIKSAIFSCCQTSRGDLTPQTHIASTGDHMPKGHTKAYIGTLIALLLCIGCQNQSSKSDKTEQLQILHDQINWDGYNNLNVYGEIIYIPIYSSVYHQGGKKFDLTSTLSVHNVDLNNPIQLIRVNYYNTDGKLIRKYIKEPTVINPFQTKQFVIPSVDTTGGTGANFVVQWVSEVHVTSPITEAIMVSTTQNQGLSFSTTGKVISTIRTQ